MPDRLPEIRERYADEIEVFAAAERRDAAREAAGLTERELEMVAATSKGLTDKMIAELYCIGPATVKTHLDRARKVLMAKNRTHAACEAIRRKLIP
jgi:DNA-binding NarL/FixJ family response regulator